MGLSVADRITIARLSGVTQRYAARGTITDQARAEAIAELTAEAAGRADLLAEHAGVSLAFAELTDGWQSAILRLQAELAMQAGADPGADPGVAGGWAAARGDSAAGALHRIRQATLADRSAFMSLCVSRVVLR